MDTNNSSANQSIPSINTYDETIDVDEGPSASSNPSRKRKGIRRGQ